MHQLMWNFIIVAHAQGSACQCNVLHIIICKLGEWLHWQGGDIKARKGEVRVEGTEEVQGAANTVDSGWLEPCANSNQNRFPLDFHHTFTVILPSLTWTLDNSKLPLTWSNFCFPSDHFHIILPSITRTMFWALKKSGKKSVLPPKHWILNFPLTCCRHLVY